MDKMDDEESTRDSAEATMVSATRESSIRHEKPYLKSQSKVTEDAKKMIQLHESSHDSEFWAQNHDSLDNKSKEIEQEEKVIEDYERCHDLDNQNQPEAMEVEDQLGKVTGDNSNSPLDCLNLYILEQIAARLDPMERSLFVSLSTACRETGPGIDYKEGKGVRFPFLLYNEVGTGRVVLMDSTRIYHSYQTELSNAKILGAEWGWIVACSTEKGIIKPFLFYPLVPTTKVTLPSLYRKGHTALFGTIFRIPTDLDNSLVCVVTMNPGRKYELHTLARKSTEWVTYPFQVEMENITSIATHPDSICFQNQEVRWITFKFSTEVWSELDIPHHFVDSRGTKKIATKILPLLPHSSTLRTLGVQVKPFHIPSAIYNTRRSSESIELDLHHFQGIWFIPWFIFKSQLFVW